MADSRSNKQLKEMPQVSVLMPVFNTEKYVRQAIDSILNQTFHDFELIILNDASTDSSKEIILSYADSRIRLVENKENKGLAYTRNRLLEEAASEFVAWLDADDVAYPTRLAEEYQFLRANPQTALVASWAKLIDSTGEPTGNFIKSYIPDAYLSALLLFVNYFVQSSVMLRKSLLPSVHYQPDFPPTEDYELWVRVAAQHPVAILPKILVDYRVHATNISATQPQKAQNTVKRNQAIQLQQLGVSPSEAEINLHYQIGFRAAESEIFLRQADEWLNKIGEYNQSSRRFNEEALRYILIHRWIKICTSNPLLGINAIKIYYKSKLAAINWRNIFLLAQYFFRTLTKK